MPKTAGETVHEYDPVAFDRLIAREKTRPGPKRHADIRWLRAHRKLAVALIIVLILAVPVAGQSLLVFIFPPVAVVGIVENCGQLSASKQTVPLGSSGFVLFTCASFAPAFKAFAQTHVTGNATLPSPYTKLYVYPSGQESNIATTCTDAPAALQINNASLIFGYTGDWSFCANYTNAQGPNLPGLSWGLVW